MVRHFLAITALVAGLATAHAEPVRMNGAEITEALAGKIVAGNQKGREWRQEFRASGWTSYRETNGGSSSPSEGRWRVQGDQYCSVWPPSDFWACYDMARDGEEIMFVESDGTQWRARYVDN